MGDISLIGIFQGKPNKLLFFDENRTTSNHQISENVLFQSLLKQNTQSSIPSGIDHESKIIEVETHRQMGKPLKNGSFHIFIIFKTVSEKDGECGEFWWSLEETVKNKVILQRSRDKGSAKNKCKETALISEKLEGKGCIRELLTFLWIHIILNVKYQRNLSRCKSLIPLIMKKITKICYEYENDFKYSALSAEESNPDLSDIINLLLNVSNWHPLVVATYLGDVELFDRVQQDGQYNINGIYNNLTLLNLAILFSKTKMVQHLLERLKADPTKCDEKGRNALHMAAKFNREKEIVNSLLKIKKIKIDQFDKTGTTALHHAIMTSNTPVVRCLLDNGANPKEMDRSDRSPLHVAAFYATKKEIIHLLLLKKWGMVNIDEGNKSGVTALHHAAMASNIATARQLFVSGADVNCRDKHGITPLHVAAFFANNMDLINLFLNNEKVNLHYCDELGQNIIAYARKNTYGLGHEIIDRVKEKDDVVLKEYNILKLAKFEMHIPIWKSLVCDLYFVNWLQPLSAPSLMKNHKWKLFYVPFADLKPGKGSEISESALIRYIDTKESISNDDLTESKIPGNTELLSDINHDSTITEFQIYQNHFIIFQSHFIIFQTTSDKDGDYWWSLDKNADYIVLQRSRDKDAVTNKFGGQVRKNVTPITSKLVGKVSINNHFNGNPVVLDFNSMLMGLPNLHPLFLLAYLGNVNLFDGIKKNTQSKPLKDYLENKLNSLWNTTKRNAFETAAKIDERDEFGRTALHFAAGTSNVDAAKHLIKMKATPDLLDKNGLTPLHLAAYHSDKTEMIDLLLEAQKKSQGDKKIDIWDDDTCDGITALHNAAIASNDITAKHLINRGADPNRHDKLGRTPLHYTAFFAKDINIVDVLLNNKQVRVNSLDNDGRNALYYAEYNQHGLTKEITNRLKEKEVTNRSDDRNTTACSLVIQHSKEEKVKTSSLEKIKNAFVKGIERVNNEAIYTVAQSRGPQFKSEFKNGHIFSDLLVNCLIIFFYFFVIFILVNCLHALSNFYEFVICFVTFITSIGTMHDSSSMSSLLIEPGIIPSKNIFQQIL